MFGISSLVPAYGRSYNSVKAVQKDFDANKDFKTSFGSLINKDQVRAEGIKSIQVRYGKNLTKTTMLRVV